MQAPTCESSTLKRVEIKAAKTETESLDCWSGTDHDAVDGAIAAVAAGGRAGKQQLVWLHQAYVDEVGHSHGWMSPQQIDATAVLDNCV